MLEYGIDLPMLFVESSASVPVGSQLERGGSLWSGFDSGSPATERERGFASTTIDSY